MRLVTGDGSDPSAGKESDGAASRTCESISSDRDDQDVIGSPYGSSIGVLERFKP